MATPQEYINLFQQLRNQGYSTDQALSVMGLNRNDLTTYNLAINTNDQLISTNTNIDHAIGLNDIDPTVDLGLPQNVQTRNIDNQLAQLDEEYGLENIILNDDGSYNVMGNVVLSTSANETKFEPNWDDWRVRLQLASNSDYLYKYKGPEGPGILAPLVQTSGIIFPYTPTINVQYNAEYSNYDLTHSNYRGYFYKGSQVQNVTLTAVFTAQDTEEANYMLASLHFLRCCTKMFYGQDTNRGMPPPLVFLSGLGEYQFKNHPCAVTAVFYNLPNDVDYIPAGIPPQGTTNLYNTNVQQSKDSGYQSWSSKITRMISSSLFKGASNGKTEAPANVPSSEPADLSMVKIYEGKTYFPTKMDITFTLLPIQTRKQVSQEFSLKDYASGKLIKKGYW